jgi:hypothetical protein
MERSTSLGDGLAGQRLQLGGRKRFWQELFEDNDLGLGLGDQVGAVGVLCVGDGPGAT